MQIDIKLQLRKQEQPLKAAVKALVEIPSVNDESDEEFPFGKGVDQALRKTLEIALGLGFRTKYGDEGYYGYAEVGEGEELVGILGHLDVVPPGSLDAWETDPFDPVEKNGRIYGRGTQDDKGPALAAMFAARALMDAGVTFEKRVRFIFCTDEETLWRGINRYLEHEERPSMGFSPDSQFPLTYAEKGLLQLHLEGDNESGLSLKGGSAFNAVPDAIVYDGVKQDALAAKLKEAGYAYKKSDGAIKVLGKAAHAAFPENGVNAIARLAITLDAIGAKTKTIDFVAHEIGEDPHAETIFGQCLDEPSGRLTLNVGKIDVGEVERLSIDIRVPVTVPKEEIIEKLRTAAGKYGLEYKEVDWLAPLYLPLDHSVIKTLMKVYRQVTGDTVSQPESSGGATFARAINNCVAYGAVRAGGELVEHQPNEYVILEDLYTAMEVYAQAIYALTR